MLQKIFSILFVRDYKCVIQVRIELFFFLLLELSKSRGK
jgi:hypothetical protein